MISQSEIHSRLNQIWQIFTAAGVTDPLTIIENLLENEESKIPEIEKILLNNNFANYDFKAVGEQQSDISDEDYRQMVSLGKQECQKGNVFQIVLSRRFYQTTGRAAGLS